MKRTSHSLLLAMFAAATLLQSAHAQSAKEPAPQAEPAHRRSRRLSILKARKPWMSSAGPML